MVSQGGPNDEVSPDALSRAAKAVRTLVSRPTVKLALRAVGLAVSLGIIGLLAWTAAAGWEEVLSYGLRFDGYWLALSLLLLVVNVLQQPAMLRFALARLGNQLSYRDAFSVLSISALSGYLPGRFWSYPSLAYLSRKRGVSYLASGVGIVTVVGASSIGAALVSLLVVGRYLGDSFVLVAVAVSLLALLAVQPGVFHWLLARVPGRWRGERKLEPLSFLQMLVLVGWQILSWLLQGLHVAALVMSIQPLAGGDLLVTVGIAAAAWLVGYYTLIAPGGLGVREGVTAFLLATLMPASLAAAAALVSQITLIAVQIACAGVAWLWARADGPADRRELALE